MSHSDSADAYLFSKTEDFTGNDQRIILEFAGGINYSSESGFSEAVSVLGTFSSDGEATITAEHTDPSEIGQTDIAAWFSAEWETLP